MTMLQNIMAGFDILGVGVVLGSMALLWGFWKVLHDDLDLGSASQPRRETKPKPEIRAEMAGMLESVPAVAAAPSVTVAPGDTAAPVTAGPTSASGTDRLDHPTAA